MKLFPAERRQRLIGGITIAFIIGTIVSAVAGVFWSTGRPGSIEVRGVQSTRLEDGGYELDISIHGPPSPDCLRVSEHFIYMYKEGKPQGIPLATTIAGPELPPMPTDYDLLLKIHPDTAYGKWNYALRIVFVCSAFPGLLRLDEWESKPFPIQLDDH